MFLNNGQGVNPDQINKDCKPHKEEIKNTQAFYISLKKYLGQHRCERDKVKHEGRY